MKIKCRYCGAYINDTCDVCPKCGAQNEDVVRTTKSQPKTIEELKEWYSDRGLPGYEVTRFFIGQNYKKPRAFGIYKDESTGNFVVYKNKDNGQRAVRYEGTDEAYAVNEIFQRLKQEIIEQKMNNVKKAKSGDTSSSGSDKPKGGLRAFLKNGTFAASMVKFILVALGIMLAPIVLIIVVGIVIAIVENEPKQGYYNYDGNTYYFCEKDYGDDYYNWYEYEADTWDGPIYRDNMPKDLRKKNHAKNYFIQSEWDNTLGCSNFNDTIYYADIQKGFNNTDSGYYKCDDTYYYHMDNSYYSGWYYYSDTDDWQSTDYSNVPDDLKHPSLAPDFYYTPTWDASTQTTDFMESAVYEEYQEEQARIEAERQAQRESSSSDSDYDWDSSDSWDSGSTDWDSDW